ncbi:MAG: tetratricopeptide repeat protein [Desulfobacterales bacterium]|jgi:tetratricopeptide (TPR) repeat protein|nr:tetratricopeptide repeat protein [Desulfobacterales bacterium]
MYVSNSDAADSLFSATLTQSTGLENLANAALQRGIERFQKKDYAGAAMEFKRSVGIGRGSSFAADAAQYLAMSHIQLGDSESAIKAYKTAFSIDPYRDDIRIKLGNLYFSQGKYEEARAEYAEAVRLNPSTANRYALGQAFIELGRFSEAENQYNEIQRLAPRQAGGYLGMGMAYSRQGKHEEAIRQFKEAINRDGALYDAYIRMGYSYADLGEMESAQEMVTTLERLDQDDLADTLSRYMYKVDPPKMMFAQSASTFPFSMGKGTPLVALNSYLMTPGASKTMSIRIQFDKKMDRESVENIANWQIGRAAGRGPGQAYNFGLPVSPNEAKLPPLPTAVAWDEKNLTATVYFSITQNAAANATIDPSHVEFKFSGKDIYGLRMNPKFDQFSGFSRVY